MQELLILPEQMRAPSNQIIVLPSWIYKLQSVVSCNSNWFNWILYKYILLVKIICYKNWLRGEANFWAALALLFFANNPHLQDIFA
jgi:hypothetical protein